MKIESIEVIPMTKESKWEDVPRQFEVSMITTNFGEWFTRMYDDVLSYDTKANIDSECIKFAKKQQAFMLAPTAIFGSQVYVAKSRLSETLDDVVIDGPLYRVEAYMTDDTSADKTVERTYVDPNTFETLEGLWYPQKKVYKIRFGMLMNG
jgi:hypothetical protein